MHKPVLLQQVLDKLDVQKGETFLDCTIGNAGHSLEICLRLGKGIKIVGIDIDADSLKRSEESLKKSGCNFILSKGNFRDLDKVLSDLKIKKVDKILFDLGWSSDQLESSGRGFSFLRDEPLLMTLKKDVSEDDFTARDILNFGEEKNIAQIIKSYGEEGFAERIAKKIVEIREDKKFETTFDLVDAINKAVPSFYKKKKIHPATKTFQALRIAVNDELNALKEGLSKGFSALESGGRMAVISFHSLEDRIVKNYFRNLKKEGLAELLTKKPEVAERVEVKENPRD
jgi:16S rRNA (cytosine1402-N4)-methyltransferase